MLSIFSCLNLALAIGNNCVKLPPWISCADKRAQGNCTNVGCCSRPSSSPANVGSSSPPFVYIYINLKAQD